MKKIFGLCLALALMCTMMMPVALATGASQATWDQLLGQTLQAVSNLSNEPATLTVMGQSSVSVAPDRAVVSIGVSAQNAEVSVAQEQANTTVDAILAALVALNVPQESIMTSQYNVYPVYDYSGDTPAPNGFQVSNQLTVIVTNFDLLNDIIDSAVQAGATDIGGLRFEVSTQNVYYQQALQGAVTNARDKAVALAQATGMTLGDLISVEESMTGGYSLYSANSVMSDAGAGATNIQAGRVEIGANVQLVFELR